MTNYSIVSFVAFYLILKKGCFMEGIKAASPVIIRFKNYKEMVDLTVKIEFKYFLMKLNYSYHN